jgi:hypothetical protein
MIPSGMNDMGPPPPGFGATSGTELPVPLSALAQPDDSEKMQTPAAGDSVSIQVDAQIVRIEGETAYVRPTAVNGNPLDEEAAEDPELPDETEGSDLRSMALNA